MNENTFIDSFFSLTPPEIQISGKYIDFFGFSKKKKRSLQYPGKIKVCRKIVISWLVYQSFYGCFKKPAKKVKLWSIQDNL